MANCTRCFGFMVQDWIPSYDTKNFLQPCLKCINCGYRVDKVFEANRQKYVNGTHAA